MLDIVYMFFSFFALTPLIYIFISSNVLFREFEKNQNIFLFIMIIKCVDDICNALTNTQ